MIFTFLENASLLLGLVYVWLQVKQNRWMWPVDILCCVALIVVFAHQRLWASMGLNIYYLLMGVIGIMEWKKESEKVEGIKIRKMSLKTALLSLVAFIPVLIILFLILKATGDPYPLTDAFIGASGVIGTVWLVRLHIENWAVWLISDIVSTILCFVSGLYSMSVLYLVYTLMSIVGWRQWKKEGRYI
ncbi:MAG: nicotinamide riboside transporter PnuC [Candidatus Cryptobacteroides sp.]